MRHRGLESLAVFASTAIKPSNIGAGATRGLGFRRDASRLVPRQEYLRADKLGGSGLPQPDLV